MGIKKERSYGLYLEATVVTEDGEELSLRGYTGQSIGFALLYKKVIPIRRFDHQYHKYGGKVIKGPHKHKWNGYDDSEVYEVDDIDISNPNKALFDFLKECNIEYNGNYQHIF